MTDVNDTARDSADPLISVTGLSVSYDVARTGKKLIAIEDVDLDVFEGEADVRHALLERLVDVRHC